MGADGLRPPLSNRHPGELQQPRRSVVFYRDGLPHRNGNAFQLEVSSPFKEGPQGAGTN
jgi:hypothetical protein